MGAQPLRVFVSHTSELAAFPEKRSYVEAACAAVRRAGGVAVDMADFGARDQQSPEVCRTEVLGCDVYLGVIGFRYGSPVPGRDDGLSHTEFEFDVAGREGMPRLVFLLDDATATVPPVLTDLDRRQVARFRRRLQDEQVTVAVANPDDLAARVGEGLATLTRAHRPSQSEPRGLWMAKPLDRVVERPELGGRLVAALTAPGAGEVGLTTGVAGAGGFGKTTLATWACHQPEVRRRYPGGLLWADVGQEVHGAGLAEKVNDLAFILSGTRPLISDPDAAGTELGRLLDEHGAPVLLVVDDVWEPAQLRPFRFGGRTCTRLVTTRLPELLPADGPRIAVEAMSAGQAADLAARGVAGLPAAVVDRLATAAGRWPVLLNLVNGALHRRAARGQPPGRAAEEILELLAAHGPTALDPARPGERSRAVAATVEASLALLDPADRDRYLDLAVFPEDVEIPLDVLALLWPDRRADAVCEELAGLGLAADYRLDHPGPRLVLHDVLRAYLRTRRSPADRAPVHRRLVAAAAGLLPAHDESRPTPWWQLPAKAGYLWRFLPYHLREAGMPGELAALVCDPRWVEAKTRHAGSAVGAVADLDLLDDPTATLLRKVLVHAAPLLGPIDPPNALGATLASRLHDIPELGAALGRYRSSLPRPRIEPAWPLPDRYDPASSSVGVGHTGSVASCAFSPDGTVLATVGDDRTARLWRIPDGAQTAVLTGHTGGVWDCAFSPDGTLLATAGDDRTARLWNVADGTEHAVLTGHTDWVTGCVFSPEGTLLATTGQDRTVRLWHVADGTQRTTLTGHTDGVLGCAFSPDGTLLATTGEDGTARLWRVADGEQLHAFAGHAGRVWACAFSPDGMLLATTGQDRTVRLWRTSGGAVRTVLTGHINGVMGCAFSPDGTLFATASLDGTARLWRMPDGTTQKVITGRAVWGCAFSPDGTLLGTNSSDGTVRLWRMPDGTTQKVITDQAGAQWGCAFSPNSDMLAITGTDGTVLLQQLSDESTQAVLADEGSAIYTCTFSPGGTRIATGGNDRAVRLWDMASGTQLAVLTGHSRALNSCAFSPDGALLATTSTDRTTRLWRTSDGTQLTVLTGHSDVVNRCAFSPDGAVLATTSDDRTARLWRISDGAELMVLTGHTTWVESCAFSPDGTLLGTASRDGTVRLWEVATGRCHCALRVAGPLIDIAWHPDGTMLCTVGGKGVYILSYQP